jgi:hypothetical protein
MNQSTVQAEDEVLRVDHLYEGLREIPPGPLAAMLSRFADRTIVDVILGLIPALLAWIAVAAIKDGGPMAAIQAGLVVLIISALVAFWVIAFLAQRGGHAKDREEKSDASTQPRNDRGRANAT